MRNHSNHSEIELLKKIAGGDQAAYTVIFEKYWDSVYSTAFRLTKSEELAQDISQDVFTRIWLNRSGLGKIENFESYLFILARNLIFSKFKHEATAQKYRRHVRDYFTDSPWTPQVTTESRQLREILEDAVKQLPPQQQKVYRLSRDGGLKLGEISQTMGISVNTVKSYISQSLATLRKIAVENDAPILPVLILFCVSQNIF